MIRKHRARNRRPKPLPHEDCPSLKPNSWKSNRDPERVDVRALVDRHAPSTPLTIQLGRCADHRAADDHQLSDILDRQDELGSNVRTIFAAQPDLVERVSWYQSDHLIFVQNGVPAMAIASDTFTEIMETVIHPKRNTAGMVARKKQVTHVWAVRDLLTELHN